MNNLDKLCGVCLQYMDQCKAHRAAATAMGLIHYLRTFGASQAEGFGSETVQVSTWHKAKGLEWPVVVLASLDKSRDATPFGAHVIPAPHFDPEQPLANRFIRFWPWPFGAQKKFPELEERLLGTEEYESVNEQARKESRRLLYVGMTRARDRVIFAARLAENKSGASLKTAWLDELTDDSGEPLIRWPMEEGHREVDVAVEKFPITVKKFSPSEEQVCREEDEQDQFLFTPSPLAENDGVWPPAHVVPSELTADDLGLSAVTAIDDADFGTRISIRGNPDFAALGSAIHGLFAVDAPSEEERLKIAARLLSRWRVEDAVDPAAILAAYNRLQAFIASRYPGAKIFREWPVSFLNEKRQRLQGWIDLLLELPEGYVIIDHKTTPSASREHAKSYAPQLLAYKEAVERATGKKVLAALLHMPVCGLVVKIEI